MSAIKYFSLGLASCLLFEALFWFGGYCTTDPESGWHTLWGALSIIIVPVIATEAAILLIVHLIRKWLGYGPDTIGK